MRKSRVWGMAAALALGGAAQTAAAEDEEPAKKPAPSFWDRMFGRNQQTAKDIMEEETAKKLKAVKQAEEAEKAREARQKEAALRARTEFERRLNVFDKLRQLALASG